MAVSPKRLTSRERRFADAYLHEAAGNGAKAAVLAGYSKASAAVMASRLLRKVHIAAVIVHERQAEVNESIADAAERRELLTAIIRDPHEETSDRLKSADILNKMDGLYILKHEHSGRVTLEQVLEASRAE